MRGLLALILVALVGLGSYDLEASKPRAVPVPVDRICPGRFQPMRDGATGLVPLCTNAASLPDGERNVRSAIVVIHGSSRTAVSVYESVEKDVRDAARTDTLILAPQFLTALDLRNRAPEPELALWRLGGWSQGDRSELVVDGPPNRLSSFEVVDRLVEELAVPGRYPNLREITIAGHSAGAQFVQRYAAGTQVEQKPAVARRRFVFRYVVANPSSYMYLFPRQPDRLTERCPRYDEYKYGLTGLNTYLSALGPDGIRAAYAQKDVILMLGGLDFQMQDPSKDDTCAAMAQGAHRQSRGHRFFQSLNQNYGPGGHHTTLVRVPGVGHSARDMFTSPEGRAVLLGR
ncbi:MAG: alpha/beta hydrolase [Chloroflexota bacterium]